jgi:hypothetical protein
MDRLPKAAIVTKLAKRLRHYGSWCGETHIQKGMYLLQDMLDVPTGFDFILYKHGPYSFELGDELTSLRADGLLALEPQSVPYGPRFAVTPVTRRLHATFPRTLAKYADSIEFVAKALGDKRVDELERVATALYVTKRRQSDHDGSVQGRAKCLNSLKPHVSVDAATQAVEEIDRLNAQAHATSEP